MKPLSALNYYYHNLGRSLPIVIVIVLTVCLLYSLCMIGGAIKTAVQVFFANPLEYFSLVYLNSGPEINAGIRKNLENYQYINKVIPGAWCTLNVRLIMGGNISTRVFRLKKDRIKTAAKQFDLQVKRGQLPSNKQEVALHWRVAADNQLAVGDKLTTDPLTGYKVVGTLSGPCVVSLAFLEEYDGANLIVIPDQDQVNQVNDFLKTLLPDTAGEHFLGEAEKQLQKLENKLFGFLIILETIVVLVLAITIGNITYIYYYQRRREFGILAAMGYTTKDILKKIMAEIVVINFISFGLGIGLALLTGYLLNSLVFEPIGEQLYLWEPSFLLITLVIPLVVLISSLIPAIKLLTTIDKVKIIEGGTG